MEKKQITIPEKDWPTSVYRTREWEQSVNVVRWEHDFVNGIYIIDFEEKTIK